MTGLVDTNVGTTLLLTPAGTVIVSGTVTTAGLLLENATTAPPLGAGAVNVTVAEAVEPPCTLAGLRLTVSSVAVGAGGAGAVTVMVAVCVVPPYLAVITEVVVELTVLVATEEVVAEVAPAGTVRVAGTVAAAVLLLDRATSAPPVGAGAVSVTVAVADGSTLHGCGVQAHRAEGCWRGNRAAGQPYVPRRSWNRRSRPRCSRPAACSRTSRSGSCPSCCSSPSARRPP